MKALTIALLGALGMAGAAGAQTAPAFPTKAEKVKGVRYLIIETIETKPDARTWEIISKHFTPAAKAAGVPIPMVYHTETGASRTITVTEMTGGTGDIVARLTDAAVPTDTRGYVSAESNPLSAFRSAVTTVSTDATP